MPFKALSSVFCAPIRAARHAREHREGPSTGRLTHPRRKARGTRARRELLILETPGDPRLQLKVENAEEHGGSNLDGSAGLMVSRVAKMSFWSDRLTTVGKSRNHSAPNQQRMCRYTLPLPQQTRAKPEQPAPRPPDKPECDLRQLFEPTYRHL